MRDSGDHKRGQSRDSAPPALRRQRLAPVSVDLRLHIDMAQTPVMNRSVPLLPELQHRSGVPPVLVEQAVAEHGDLGEEVEGAVEDGEEEQQPHQKSGERASEDAVDDVGGGVAENRVHELHHDDVHQREADEHRDGELDDVAQADGLRARVGELVEQCGRHAARQSDPPKRQEIEIMAQRVRDLLGRLLLQTVVGQHERVALQGHQHDAHHRNHGGERSTVERAAEPNGMSEFHTIAAKLPT